MAPHEFQRQFRNLFAVLRTLVRQTREGRDSVEDYAAHLEGRIGALARVHEILMRAPQEGIDLYELVCGELLAQAIPANRFHLSGSEVRIACESVVALALTFHELTVNALTHGAFATAEGRAEITWSIETNSGHPELYFQWQEIGTPVAAGSMEVQGIWQRGDRTDAALRAECAHELWSNRWGYSGEIAHSRQRCWYYLASGGL